MGCEVLKDHDDIIKVNEQRLPVELTENLLYELLEGSRGEGQPKWQHLPFSELVQRYERSLSLGVRTKGDLPVPAKQVQHTEILAKARPRRPVTHCSNPHRTDNSHISSRPND